MHAYHSALPYLSFRASFREKVTQRLRVRPVRAPLRDKTGAFAGVLTPKWPRPRRRAARVAWMMSNSEACDREGSSRSGSHVVGYRGILALVVVRRYAFYNRTYVRFVVILVIVAIVSANCVPLLALRGFSASMVTAIVAAAGLFYALGKAFANFPGRRRWLAEAAHDPLILAAPFEGAWRVAAGGPDPGDNHHLIASDQRFAYDFIRTDRASLGSPILAPVTGRVVASCDGKLDHRASLRVIEDPSPLGNYVAIDTGKGVVFLCHLQNGSVLVHPGDQVMVGTAIGQCGNSGRTSRPHLHIHAQNLANYAFNRARGISIAFLRHESPAVLRVGDSLKHQQSSP